MLYIVSTPIGNLKDISQRALEVLGKVKVIIAESPSDSLVLLRAYNLLGKKIIKYNDKNKHRITERILEILSKEDAAYITSAGTPTISDPGADLVRAAREKKIEIGIIPGPSALISALAASGIRAREFTFVSFCPRKKEQLKNFFTRFQEQESVLVFFESPFRILKTLEVLKEVAPSCYLCVAKEMTKIFENYFCGSPEEVLAQINQSPKNLKGEFSVVVDFRK